MLLRDAPSRRASKHAASTRCRSSLLIVFSKEGLPSRLERSTLSEEVIHANAPHAGSGARLARSLLCHYKAQMLMSGSEPGVLSFSCFSLDL